MLFEETFVKVQQEINTALDEFFEVIKANQTHEQDLLLVEVNGFYMEGMNPLLQLSPFVIGPGGWVYESDHTQYRFFDYYRRQIVQEKRDVFFKDFDSSEIKQEFNDISIQMELSVYLKFWESDRMLKKLYQLSNLALGKNYDWFFEIDKDDSRQKIIRELIRNPIKDVCPKYYQLLKDIYLSQIRNAAAHSQFYISGRKLGFNNYDLKNHAPLGQIDFEEWEQRFHKLILLYNGLIGRLNKSHKEYVELQNDKEFGLQIRLTSKDGCEKMEWIKYVEEPPVRKDWMWYNNWKKHYK